EAKCGSAMWSAHRSNPEALHTKSRCGESPLPILGTIPLSLINRLHRLRVIALARRGQVQRGLTAFLILTRRTPGYSGVHGTLHAYLRRGGREAVTRGRREGREPGRADAGRLPGPPGLLRHHRGGPRF